MKTICHNCEGRGFTVIRVRSTARASQVTAGQQANLCKVCGGTGWLKGLVPPV